MASDAGSVGTTVTRLVQASVPTHPVPIKTQTAELGGKSLPPGGQPMPTGSDAQVAQSAPAHAKPPPPPPAGAKGTVPGQLETLVALLNKALNDSGRPNQYRVGIANGAEVIQEINPANGKVIGEFSAAQFPALARSLGASGLLISGLA